MREMSGSWILVQGPTTMEVLAQPQIVNSYGGAPGQGNFTEEEDKAILAEVLPQVLRDKLMWSLRAGDLVAYRVHLNLRSVLLRFLSLAEGEKTPFPCPRKLVCSLERRFCAFHLLFDVSAFFSGSPR